MLLRENIYSEPINEKRFNSMDIGKFPLTNQLFIHFICRQRLVLNSPFADLKTMNDIHLFAELLGYTLENLVILWSNNHAKLGENISYLCDVLRRIEKMNDGLIKSVFNLSRSEIELKLFTYKTEAKK